MNEKSPPFAMGFFRTWKCDCEVDDVGDIGFQLGDRQTNLLHGLIRSHY